MNFKLLTAATLLLTIGSAIPVLSADKEEVSIFRRTGKCIDCNLSKIFENKASFKNINVQGANLSEGSFYHSDLRNANFSYTNSKGVSFGGSDLRNANFSFADVSKVYFCGADLRGVNWEGITYSTKPSCLPDEAIGYVPTVSNNSNQNYNNCPSVTPVPNANPRSLNENVNDVKKATETVKDILKLF